MDRAVFINERAAQAVANKLLYDAILGTKRAYIRHAKSRGEILGYHVVYNAGDGDQILTEDNHLLVEASGRTKH